MKIIKVIFLIIGLIHLCSSAAVPEQLTYDKIRSKIIDAEVAAAIGGEVWLTAKEDRANSILMGAKNREIEDGFLKPEMYAPSMHFFKAKPLIKESEVFRIIKIMPKGAFLHGHNTAMVSSKWVIRNLTRQFDVSTCYNKNGALLFTFRNSSKCVTPLYNLSDDRSRATDKVQFDRQLEKHINMYIQNPQEIHPNLTAIWTKFENIFDTVNDLYKYVPAFRVYHRRILEELYEDNVFYAEIRAPLSSLYGTDKEYKPYDVALELESIVEEFKTSHPDFIGAKIIYATRNKGDNEAMETKVDIFKDLFEKMPNFVIGFDLIGQEDYGEPLHKYVKELSDMPPDAKLFFHSGETNWYGKTDWNMLDAILLQTNRIGHGYALFKHPQLRETVKSRGIAIEISPISNQVLRLIWDLRNHPASFYMSENLPVVISADDPGVWNSKGLSFDFYYAFMSIASAEADLKTLKQLVLNSIQYSILTAEERRKANQVFRKKWDDFIDNIIASRY